MKKEYEINIDPRILELLGPNLYTNIYYVLAELIANAYDAEAHNVYVIAYPDRIIVEDDGCGMSYEDREIENYLHVAKESRSNDEDSFTPHLNRKKMGRKGVGKLAALSVSENVYVKTVKDNDKSGFILSRHIAPDRKLPALAEADISFEKTREHGTAIVMMKPQYRLPKSLLTLKRNLLKLFPLVNDDFQLHLLRGDEEIVISDPDKEIIQQLGTLITLGDEFENLASNYKCDYPESKEKLLHQYSSHRIPVSMENKDGEELEYMIEINGWIGTYRSTRGRKKSVTDFPDNFISLYANKKLGEFNILPYVGQNKLSEVYVVGQLHIDLFEETSLPDMSLSNRQGYKTDDPRYELAIEYIREKLLPEVLRMRDTYVGLKKKESDQRKWNEKKKREEEFKENVIQFQTDTSKKLADKLTGANDLSHTAIQKIVHEQIVEESHKLGLKPIIDQQKKKILISHTRRDKDLADIIYNMLLYNGVPARDILYTNCDDEVARIPEDVEIYDYLRAFFVDSISTQKIYVIYVTSEDMGKSWGAISEVGAGWITAVNHKIFNIGSFSPGHPLENAKTWLQAKRSDHDLYVDTVNYDVFCQKIESVCKELGYPCHERSDNKTKLSEYITVVKTDVFASL